jgi:hypothetical protein
MNNVTLMSISAILASVAVAAAGCDSGSSGLALSAGGNTGRGGSTASNAGGSTASNVGSSTVHNAGGSSATSAGGSSSHNEGGSSANNEGGAKAGDGEAGSDRASDALPMDSTGRVSKDSNSLGIQGSWYWYADYSDGHGGLTQLPDVKDNTAPYVEGKGMCVIGTTPGGAKDGYVTWGAGIGLNLNQGTEEDGDSTPQKLKPYPRCLTITLSEDSSSPGGILGKLLEANPMPGTTADSSVPQEAPSVPLKAGQSTDVCVDNVKQLSWCTASSHKPGDCADPQNLENGIASVQIQALAGASGGNINVCVVSIVPKN